MIRLWHRVGVFRVLSVTVLVLGVVGGMYLSAARQSQQRVLDSAQETQASAQDQTRRLDLVAADRERQSAASRSAQREAQSKADAAASAAAEQAKAAEEAAQKAKQAALAKPSDKPSPAPSKKGPTVPIPGSCNAYTGNVAIGCSLVLKNGLPISEMACLKPLWMKESGWRTGAANGAGAYGIPQALPGSKMAVYGSNWKYDAGTQITWGLNYIKNKYGTPCNAWSVWQRKGWY